MKLIFSLVFPWLTFFALSLFTQIGLSLYFAEFLPLVQEYLWIALLVGTLVCCYFNFQALGDAGIWISDLLPQSVRWESHFWFLRAGVTALLLVAFYYVSQLSFMPLLWPGLVFPVLFSIGLFVIVWNLVGPILRWSAKFSWSRSTGVLMNLPVLILVPITSVYIGKIVTDAYHSSHANLAMKPIVKAPDLALHKVQGKIIAADDETVRIFGEILEGDGQKHSYEIKMRALAPDSRKLLTRSPRGKELTLKAPLESIQDLNIASEPGVLAEESLRQRLSSTKATERAAALREIYEYTSNCSDYDKDIQKQLSAKGQKDVVYWAIKALQCSNVKSFVALPRLVDIMAQHSDVEVRALAITTLRRYGEENLRNLAYLLVKRLSEKEPLEVLKATAQIMAALGGDNSKFAVTRLKSLLNSETASLNAAKILVDNFKMHETVTTFIQEQLSSEQAPSAATASAVAMICALPKNRRGFAKDYMKPILASVKTMTKDDKGISALRCLGKDGFMAVKEEFEKPEILDRARAIEALTVLESTQYPEMLTLASNCAQDDNEEIRKACSQILGSLGAPALPKILELLESKDPQHRKSGEFALNFFEDKSAESTLRKVVIANSGWMATNKKLKMAHALGNALSKIEKSTTGTNVE